MADQQDSSEANSLPELDYSNPPAGSDRRSFMMRSAMATAIVALGGKANPLFAQVPAQPPLEAAPPDPNLEVVKQCGHAPHLEKPDEFVRLALDFLP